MSLTGGDQAQAGSFPQGYAQALKQQQAELDMILKEIALEQAERFGEAKRPELRLAMMMASTLMTIDAANRFKSLQADTVKAGTRERFEGL